MSMIMRNASGIVPLARIVVVNPERQRLTKARECPDGQVEAGTFPDPSPIDGGGRESSTDHRSVSVIIPFSKPDKIDNCIRSVLAQNYPMDLVEVFVVGWGSTEVGKRWPQVRAIDVGPIFRPGKARNHGAKYASGDVLLFIDDDCIAQPDWLRESLVELRGDSVGAVGGMVVGTLKNAISRAVDFSNFSLCQIELRQERPLCTATFAINREVFEEVGGFDESLKVHEDVDICHRLISSGYKTVYQPRVKVLHDHGRVSIGSLIRYMYYGGREGGLVVEENYASQSALYRLLLRLKHPLAYSLSILPLAIAATLQTVRVNSSQHKSVLLLSPLILLAKLSCHIGIWRWSLQEWMANRSVLREMRRLFDYTLIKRWIRTPRVMTLFVTSQCNAKCKHCFYWENLNQQHDLTFDEIRDLSNSLGKVDVLLISGGEPMLRRDLPEICELFFEQNDLGQLTIPTNGLLPELTREHLGRILSVSRGRPVHLALSVDGTEHMHDEIRAVPGNFKKAVATYAAILPLQEKHHNLRLRVNSTVLNRNYEDLFEFFAEHQRFFPGVNTPSLSLLRGSPFDKSLLLPSIGDLQRLYAHRNKHVPGRRSRLTRIMDSLVFSLSLETIKRDTQIVPCEAGRIQAVVEDNGNVKHCELLAPIGNLRAAGFNEIWNSQKAKAERQRIVDKECRCTHECFLYPSLLAHPTISLKMLVREIMGKSRK